MNNHATILQQRLLKHGGESIDARLKDDPHLAELVRRARLFPDLQVEKVKGRPNQCHKNTALLYCVDPDSYEICTGYGLLKNGHWNMHSWLTCYDLILETTKAKYVKYYGMKLDIKEACFFVMANVLKELPGFAVLTKGLPQD